MSTYENYHKTSQVYDKTRTAGGVDIILNAMEEGNLPLSEQVLLDAGCGTGLYSAALVNKVRRIEAVDLTLECWAWHKRNCSQKKSKVELVFTSLQSTHYRCLIKA